MKGQGKGKESPSSNSSWFPITSFSFPLLFPSLPHPGPTSSSHGTFALLPPQVPSVFSQVSSPPFPQPQLLIVPASTLNLPALCGILQHTQWPLVFLPLPGTLHDISSISRGPMEFSLLSVDPCAISTPLNILIVSPHTLRRPHGTFSHSHWFLWCLFIHVASS